MAGLVPAPLPPRTYTPVPSIGATEDAHRGPRTSRPSHAAAPKSRDWPSGVVRDGSDAERERGRPADVLVVAVDGRSWTTITAASGLEDVRGTSAKVVLDTPLLPASGATLQACASGDYRAHWLAFAARLDGLKTAPIVDLGAAMNREGAPWSGDPGAYARCWSEVARTVKKAAPNVAFQWTPTLGSQPGMPGVTVLAAWPERSLVDVVGVDAIADGRPWSEQVNGAYGLNYWAAFADRRGRRIAVARWGVRAGVSDARTVNPAYIHNMHDWVARVAAKQALAYEAYSEPADAPKRVTDAYRDLF
ncbi:hypothetical protein [Mobilicoccus massiliensis]|uniref:hypothetical protein n=1 Tax=Mobilicoccus massiliensis TaxID=1522310 RepID=UPI0011430A68|nr:hypothetical protein [Mobilicoccus massiliensis]